MGGGWLAFGILFRVELWDSGWVYGNDCWVLASCMRVGDGRVALSVLGVVGEIFLGGLMVVGYEFFMSWCESRGMGLLLERGLFFGIRFWWWFWIGVEMVETMFTGIRGRIDSHAGLELGFRLIVLLVGVPVFVIRWVFAVVSVRCMGGFMWSLMVWMVVLGRNVLYDVWVELGFWLGDSGDDNCFLDWWGLGVWSQ